MSKKYYESIPEDQVSALSLAVTSEVLAEFDCMDESMSSRLYGVVETAILHELTKDCLPSGLSDENCYPYGEIEPHLAKCLDHPVWEEDKEFLSKFIFKEDYFAKYPLNTAREFLRHYMRIVSTREALMRVSGKDRETLRADLKTLTLVNSLVDSVKHNSQTESGTYL